MKKLFILLVLVSLLFVIACGGAGTTTTTHLTNTTPTVPPATASSTTVPPTTTPPPPTSTSTTPAIPPSVTTGNAATITFASAVLNGALVNTVEGSVDQLGFRWGTSPGNYPSAWTESGDFLSGPFNHLIDGLTNGVVYYFTSEMHTGAGWQYGAEQSFRTQETPKINTIDPNSALQGQNLTVTITGSGYTGVTGVSFGDGITVNNFSVASYTQITANITIAADAVAGPRIVSVTTPLGGILDGGFTVKQIKLVSRTLTWKDADFSALLHQMTTDKAAAYDIRFHDGNQMTLVSTQSFNMGIEVLNGKLAFINVPQQAWDDVFSTAAAYLSYDSVSRVVTVNSFPAAVLTTYFNPPETTTPVLNTEVATEGHMTITYSSPGEV